MENQSPTHETLIDKRDKIVNSIKENINYIYIVIMVLANTILSLLKIENGKIGLSYPNTLLGWVLWATQIALITLVGVMILSAFRRQGIKLGHEDISEVYDSYLKAVTMKDVEKSPRSLKEYQKQQALRDTISKATILVALNLLVMSVIITLNTNSLVALFVNIIFSIAFGIKAMLDAEEFVMTELVIWYRIKLKEIEKKGAKKNGNKKS